MRSTCSSLSASSAWPRGYSCPRRGRASERARGVVRALLVRRWRSVRVQQALHPTHAGHAADSLFEYRDLMRAVQFAAQDNHPVLAVDVEVTLRNMSVTEQL